MSIVLKETGIDFSIVDEKNDMKILEFKRVSIIATKNILINSGPFFEIIVYNELNKFEIKSNILQELENSVSLKNVIKQVICTIDNCYLLDIHGNVSQYNVKTKNYSHIQNNIEEKIIHIAATFKSFYAVTSANNLYEILPEIMLIYKLKNYEKVKKIDSGLEHILILTTNGDVYSYGCSLRGQMGTGTMNFKEPMKLVDALSGIKIIDIACSAFSSFAISSFNDLYTFGWNTNGQMGLKSNNKSKQVYSLPEIVELPTIDGDAIVKVYCGHKHTVVRTEKNKIFVAGLNNYGQLGLKSYEKEIDKFKEVLVDKIDNDTILCCGHFKTYLINKC